MAACLGPRCWLRGERTALGGASPSLAAHTRGVGLQLTWSLGSALLRSDPPDLAPPSANPDLTWETETLSRRPGASCPPRSAPRRLPGCQDGVPGAEPAGAPAQPGVSLLPSPPGTPPPGSRTASPRVPAPRVPPAPPGGRSALPLAGPTGSSCRFHVPPERRARWSGPEAAMEAEGAGWPLPGAGPGG